MPTAAPRQVLPKAGPESPQSPAKTKARPPAPANSKQAVEVRQPGSNPRFSAVLAATVELEKAGTRSVRRPPVRRVAAEAGSGDIRAAAPVASGQQGRKPAVLGAVPGLKPQPKDVAAAETPASSPQSAAIPGDANASPDSDPGFQAVVQRAKAVARTQRKPDEPPQVKADQAHLAARPPRNDVRSRAEARHVKGVSAELSAEPEREFNQAAFIEAITAKIGEITARLKSPGDVEDFKEKHQISKVKGSMSSELEKGETAARQPVDKLHNPPSTVGIKEKDTKDLPSPAAGPPPPNIHAAEAAPKPKPESEISIADEAAGVGKLMADAGVTESQLQESNEPVFLEALQSKHEAETAVAQMPEDYRKSEIPVLAAGRADLTATAAKSLHGMHGSRGSHLQEVHGKQDSARAVEEFKHALVVFQIETMFAATEWRVKDRLDRLDKEVNHRFDVFAQVAQENFEDDVEAKLDAYKEDRYGSLVGGTARWWRDKFKDLPEDDIKGFYEDGRKEYERYMRHAITVVAGLIGTGLREAKEEIRKGEAAIQTFLNGLDKDVVDVGMQAADEIRKKFRALERSVDDKQNEFVDTLAHKYVDRLKKLDERIEELKAENRGLISRARDAVVGAVRAIMHLKDMLFHVLARVASTVLSIIAHPIRFAGNLSSGVKRGFDKFRDHSETHLEQGLSKWVFGAMAVNIEAPKGFDWRSILEFVLQVLGLTRPKIRERAVSILGVKLVTRIEQASEIFSTLVTQGPAGVWNLIEDKVGNLKELVFNEIKAWVKERILMAGVKWIVSLLSPASAFIKACKAIYDIIIFFVERASQIVELIDAILDSVQALVDGALDAAANAIENALAAAIPVVLGFLASFLGVSGITDKVRSVIDNIQERITQAIDWVIQKAVTVAKAAGKLLGIGKEEKAGLPVAELDQQEPEAVPAAEETKTSREVKSKIRAELEGKSLKPEDDPVAIMHSIYVKYHPQGLKGIELVPAKTGDHVDVLVNASLTERIASMTPADIPELLKIARKMRYNARATTLYITYAGRFSFRDAITQKGRKQAGHAEHRLLVDYADLLLDEIAGRIKSGDIKEQPVPIVMEINRMPCVGCAGSHIPDFLKKAKAHNLRVTLTIRAASPVMQGVDKSLKKLWQPGVDVEVTPLKIWEVIEQKMKEFEGYEYEGQFYTYGEFLQFKSKAYELQWEIDRAAKEVENTPKHAVSEGNLIAPAATTQHKSPAVIIRKKSGGT